MSGLVAPAKYNRQPIASLYGALQGYSSSISSVILPSLFYTCLVTIGVFWDLLSYILNLFKIISVYSDCRIFMILFSLSLVICIPRSIFGSPKFFILNTWYSRPVISFLLDVQLLASIMSSTYSTRNAMEHSFLQVNKHGSCTSLCNTSLFTSSVNLWFHLFGLTFKPYNVFFNLQTLDISEFVVLTPSIYIYYNALRTYVIEVLSNQQMIFVSIYIFLLSSMQR